MSCIQMKSSACLDGADDVKSADALGTFAWTHALVEQALTNMSISQVPDGFYTRCMQAYAVPLCVDLDGVLLLDNLTRVSVKLLLRSGSLNVLRTLGWMHGGRAVLKAKIASHITLNPDLLTYDADVLRWLEIERGVGRIIWLSSSSSVHVVRCIADYLGLFDGVIASDHENLTPTVKARRLVELFGNRGFDYCGNSLHDKVVLRHARSAVGFSKGVRFELSATRYAARLSKPRRGIK